MKWFWAIAVIAALVLGVAAVTMGGLNQDEGWYLYAANLMHEGKMPYRDFFYTQGPLMPVVYSCFTWVWKSWGLAGARVLTLLIGMAGIVMAMFAAKGEAKDRGNEAALVVFMLLATNLYHLYYLTIPKTYALAAFFISAALCMLHRCPIGCGLALAFAAGTRISLGVILPVVGIWLGISHRWKDLLWFCIGGFAGLAAVYLPILVDEGARAGLIAAQRYHAARGGSDLVWTIGSLSRLVRWYLPVFIVFGLGGFRRIWVVMVAFLSVFTVQMLAPFPYEDYQVPIMAALVVFAAVNYVGELRPKGMLLVLGMCLAVSFGSPLLEKWSTNGQDRFWSIKKESSELRQLQEVAKTIEKMDPEGKELLTQDLYLAIETGRKVPRGLEMGPFSQLSDDEWRRLLDSAPCEVAALSGYSFAIEPPKCNERSMDRQLEFWNIVKSRYRMEEKVVGFGQNATSLLLLKRK